MRKQTYKTSKAVCARCGEESQSTEKVSARILPPNGGKLCPPCLLPAALEAQSEDC